MSETKNLKLFKHEEPLETNNNKFDIDKALNKNWDKVDDYAGEANSKIDLITEIIDLLPKVSNKGESITLENTARAKFTKFRTKGNSSQETRSGKNKIIFDDIKETVNQGITCSIKNGVITLNGTASGVVNFYSNPINISAGKYTLSKNMEGTWSLGTATSSLAILLQQKEKDGSYTTVKGGELTAYSSTNNFTTLDLAEGTYRIRVFIATGNILNNFTWRPQLEEGENFTGFEQGGLMPSVEFPSEIRNVGDNINVFNKTAEDFKNGISYGWAKKLTLKLEPNTLYTCSSNDETPIGGNTNLLFGGNLTDRYFVNKDASRTCLTNGDGDIDIYLRATSIDDFFEKYYIKVEKGTRATTSSEYGCGNLEIIISNENLGNNESHIVFPFVQGQKLMQGDYLADDGIHHTRKQIVLDGSDDENWAVWTASLTNVERFYTNLEKKLKDNGTSLCSHFKFSNINSDTEHFSWSTSAGIRKQFVIFIDKSKATTVTELKTWLSQNPITVEYELAEEEIETYTEVQKEVYEQIKNAISYKGQTNIFSTNEIKPIFEVEALADIGLLLNNMQAQILAGGE